MTKDYPTSTVGGNKYLTSRDAAMETYLANHRDNFGLIFFVQKTCQYCAIQSSILGAFLDRYRWDATTVDIDVEPGLAQRFDITFTPQILLVKRNSQDYQRIATGVETLPNLKSSAYRAIRYMNGEIQPEQYFMMDYQKNSAFDPLTEGTPR